MKIPQTFRLAKTGLDLVEEIPSIMNSHLFASDRTVFGIFTCIHTWLAQPVYNETILTIRETEKVGFLKGSPPYELD